MTGILEKHYDWFLSVLKELVKKPSVFTNHSDIKSVIQYCTVLLKSKLGVSRVFRDHAGNLIAFPCNIDNRHPCLYLSAHVDTVGFDENQWSPPFHPLKPFESKRELVGRGVSDCKAGVAFQLYLSYLHSIRAIFLRNTVLTITFNEEGGGTKSGALLGKAMGKTLPLGPGNNLLLVLENNVSLSPCKSNPPTLWAYHRERGNFVIKTKGSLPTIQTFLRNNPNWNPTCIFPEKDVIWNKFKEVRQTTRHVCSVPKTKNQLYQALISAHPNCIMKSGSESSFSILPSPVKIGRLGHPVDHFVVLSNRSFDTIAVVESQLRNLIYTPLKPFGLSQGVNSSETLQQSPFYTAIQTIQPNDINIKLGDNIGCSDASIIYNALAAEQKPKIIPLVMGPGTRSQPDSNPPRFTHGPNETFDKKAGLKAVKAIASFLERCGFINPNST